jgi:shikimate 5-dehydrogenase
VVAQKLGLRPLYYNRTPAKAAALVENFGGTQVLSLDEKGELSLGSLLAEAAASDEGGQLRAVISTLPAAAEFELPAWILAPTAAAAKPVIFDVNYKPYHTALLRQAEAADCAVVRGSEMLWEQGVGQFELWTGRTAPYAVMKEAVLSNCRPVEEDDDDDDEDDGDLDEEVDHDE